MPFSTQFPAPHHVGIKAFGDFADDMMGYGYDELLPGTVVDFENSERDIRPYTYKESESKWIPHKRQSKKVADEIIDDGAVTGDDDDLFIADE
ncbi:unnamed protein product [Cylicocyclus nassatus]|uniref:Uncharacterized protein n=1 Tax=Cylicocyclus nassatus TaxID=53992 RepID=A0AA36DS90_CYLNA|nr:unnamed protein product [Cylicocyclus nassatus]